MKPVFFKKGSDFRKWLKKHHVKEKELIVGFYKVDSGKPSMTWSESVDEALCFGWIDGVRRSLGEESYTIRFTPRKAGSTWSTVNINKIKVLKEQRLMQPAGLAAYERREEKRSGIYAHEKAAAKLTANLEKKFKANKKAWAFFSKQAPSYQKVMINWIAGAKQEATREKRLTELMRDSAAGERLKQMEKYRTKGKG